MILKRYEILLQKISPKKLFMPNTWDVSIAGHLQLNEGKKEGILREFSEETLEKFSIEEADVGLLTTQKIEYQSSHQKKSRKVFRYIFVCTVKRNQTVCEINDMIKKWSPTDETQDWKWESIKSCTQAAILHNFDYSLVFREIFSDKNVLEQLGKHLK